LSALVVVGFVTGLLLSPRGALHTVEFTVRDNFSTLRATDDGSAVVSDVLTAPDLKRRLATAANRAVVRADAPHEDVDLTDGSGGVVTIRVRADDATSAARAATRYVDLARELSAADNARVAALARGPLDRSEARLQERAADLDARLAQELDTSPSSLALAEERAAVAAELERVLQWRDRLAALEEGDSIDVAVDEPAGVGGLESRWFRAIALSVLFGVAGVFACAVANTLSDRLRTRHDVERVAGEGAVVLETGPGGAPGRLALLARRFAGDEGGDVLLVPVGRVDAAAMSGAANDRLRDLSAESNQQAVQLIAGTNDLDGDLLRAVGAAATLLVVRSSATRAQLEEALHSFAGLDLPLAGIILDHGERRR
jgi:hypothetical protein